ncbi:malate dehydrogenase [Mycena venus]|uniref:malate dehydrogenase n=1 Tax=Mycena venus TaxID=2733690 RepID=A0A8H6WR90_9AGAR|nr:malate dehydrogenase [Mycena venus]
MSTSSAPKHFPTRQLGTNGPTVSALGFGTMGIGAYYGQTDKSEAFKTLSRAADLGIRFWDTADIYGNTEEVLGEWFTQTGRREEIFLATKFGAIDLRPDAPKGKFAPCSDPVYIAHAFARSLALLQTSYVDLYYQHRVDPNVPIEVVLETLRPFVEEGKIRWLGLSECSAATLRRARAVKGVGEKVVAVQMEYSPFDLEIETSGLLEAAREMGVAVVPYSPLGRGLLTGKYRSREDFEEGDYRRTLPRFSDENFPKNLALVDHLQQIADKYHATSGQVALAWMLAEHPDFFPIPGTRNVARLEENARGAEISLSAEDVKDIRAWAAAADVQGERKRAEHMSDGECIGLEEWKAKAKVGDSEHPFIMVKAVVLGAAGGIGQPLSLLLKTNPAITALGLFDIVNTPGVAVDLSHIDTPAVVVGRLPPNDGLKEVLTGADVVVIPAGVPRKPGMTRDDLFKINAGIVKDLATGIATVCPKAFVLVISNPVNSTVPIVAEVFKKHGVYDPKRIFGVTTLDVVRASTFVAEIIGKPGAAPDVVVPVVGGHSGVTIVPLLSQSSHPLPADLAKDKFDALVNRIQFGGDEVVAAKDGAGSATLSMAYAGFEFANKIIRAVKGEKGIVAPSFVALEADPAGAEALSKDLGAKLAFFSSNVELGPNGVVKIHPLGKLTEAEVALVKAAVPELREEHPDGAFPVLPLLSTGVTYTLEKYEAEEKNPKL